MRLEIIKVYIFAIGFHFISSSGAPSSSLWACQEWNSQVGEMRCGQSNSVSCFRTETCLHGLSLSPSERSSSSIEQSFLISCTNSSSVTVTSFRDRRCTQYLSLQNHPLGECSLPGSPFKHLNSRTSAISEPLQGATPAQTSHDSFRWLSCNTHTAEQTSSLWVGKGLEAKMRPQRAMAQNGLIQDESGLVVTEYFQDSSCSEQLRQAVEYVPRDRCVAFQDGTSIFIATTCDVVAAERQKKEHFFRRKALLAQGRLDELRHLESFPLNLTIQVFSNAQCQGINISHTTSEIMNVCVAGVRVYCSGTTLMPSVFLLSIVFFGILFF